MTTEGVGDRYEGDCFARIVVAAQHGGVIRCYVT